MLELAKDMRVVVRETGQDALAHPVGGAQRPQAHILSMLGCAQRAAKRPTEPVLPRPAGDILSLGCAPYPGPPAAAAVPGPRPGQSGTLRRPARRDRTGPEAVVRQDRPGGDLRALWALAPGGGTSSASVRPGQGSEGPPQSRGKVRPPPHLVPGTAKRPRC